MRSPLGLRGRGGVARTAIALFAVVACVAPSSAFALINDRGWELVTPIDKNGGDVLGAGTVAHGGVFQAAADGDSVTYSSSTSFADEASAAPPGSQYISTHVPGGWATENINVSIFSGAYGADPDGVPYQHFSPDLTRGLLLNGTRCRAEEGFCPVSNPPLAGTDAPAGYQNYYLRRGLAFEAIIGAEDVAHSAVDPSEFTVRLAGVSEQVDHVVIETCAALTPGATEVPLGGGCDPEKQNLYGWGEGSGLYRLNSAPGARLAAAAGAVSTDASRVYFVDGGSGNLQLNDGGTLQQVDGAAGGDGIFETASADGATAFFTKAGHLWRFSTSTDSAEDLTPAGGVVGVLGASADGTHVYYLAGDGLYAIGPDDTAVKAAAAADPSNYPPATGTARVSGDGTRLLFVSTESLTGYDNRHEKTDVPLSEVFLYDAAAGELSCISCRPNGTRPIGSSTIPGATANGQLPEAFAAYKPRVLSLAGDRVFFDSTDSLRPFDVNRENDVYEWQGPGTGCDKPAGCIELISNGRSPGGARFIDASETGDDVFFVTDAPLVAADPGSFDLYDARVGGGYPDPPAEIPCFGDACVSLPSEPVDPALNTLNFGPGNPKVRYFRYGGKRSKSCKRRPGKKKARARCASKGKGKHGKNSKKKGGRR
jgi:hypothetical protein